MLTWVLHRLPDELEAPRPGCDEKRQRERELEGKTAKCHCVKDSRCDSAEKERLRN